MVWLSLIVVLSYRRLEGASWWIVDAASSRLSCMGALLLIFFRPITTRRTFCFPEISPTDDRSETNHTENFLFFRELELFEAMLR